MVYHRSREQPIADPNESPINQIKFYLDRYRIKDALQIFFNEQTLRLLHVEPDFMWDIIPLICRRLRGLCQYRFRVFEGCERMLCRIAVDENCNPKEVLISLLAEIGHQDECHDDNVFRAMIRPLEGTLLRMNCPNPRDENLRWVLNVLLRYINEIELPKEYNLEGKKRLALPNDTSVKRFIEILPLMLSFVEEFNDRSLEVEKSSMPILTESQIDEVLNGELNDDDLISDNQPLVGDGLVSSINTLSALMYRPLTFLDLTNQCEDLKLFSNRCLNTLLRLRPDLFSPIYRRLTEYSTSWDMESYTGKSTCGISCNESTIALATCSYIYRCERLLSPPIVQSFPQIITNEFVLFCHLPYVLALLERTEILVHEKGLTLLENLLSYLKNNSLGQKFLDCCELMSLSRQLFRIMIFSPLCTNRKKAYDLFICVCDLLTYECKFKMFKDVLTQSDLRPCIRAACIDQYRRHLTIIYRELMKFDFSTTTLSDEKSNGIDEFQNSSENLDAIQRLKDHYEFLGGQSLVEFLNLCIEACLSCSHHTDIIENYEVLLATLTMFRFLKLRKVVHNDRIEEEYLNGSHLKKLFFDPIRNAIALIANELKSYHKTLETSKGTRTTGPLFANQSDSTSELSMLSRILGSQVNEFIKQSEDRPRKVENQDEIECLNWAMCRLDLVESVLVRTCDLYSC